MLLSAQRSVMVHHCHVIRQLQLLKPVCNVIVSVHIQYVSLLTYVEVCMISRLTKNSNLCRDSVRG